MVEQHPRNPYQAPLDFVALFRGQPSLRKHFLEEDAGGPSSPSFSWTSPGALHDITRVLLEVDFGVCWAGRADRLCPPVPNRLNYLLWIEDLVASWCLLNIAAAAPAAAAPAIVAPLVAVDIGTGASAIFPLVGHATAGWRFVATDIDGASLAASADVLERNGIDDRHVRLLRVVPPCHPDSQLKPAAASRVRTLETDSILLAAAAAAAELSEECRRASIFPGTVAPGAAQLPPWPPWKVCAVVCNPPFFASWEEAQESMARNPSSACTGTESEMATPGGEAAFVGRMAAESAVACCRGDVLWFSAMLGKQVSVVSVVGAAARAGATCIRTTELLQGRTRRWAVAWSFYPASAFLAVPPAAAGREGGGSGYSSSGSSAWRLYTPWRVPAASTRPVDGARGGACGDASCATRQLLPRQLVLTAAEAQSEHWLAASALSTGKRHAESSLWTGGGGGGSECVGAAACAVAACAPSGSGASGEPPALTGGKRRLDVVPDSPSYCTTFTRPFSVSAYTVGAVSPGICGCVLWRSGHKPYVLLPSAGDSQLIAAASCAPAATGGSGGVPMAEVFARVQEALDAPVPAHGDDCGLCCTARRVELPLVLLGPSMENANAAGSGAAPALLAVWRGTMRDRTSSSGEPMTPTEHFSFEVQVWRMPLVSGDAEGAVVAVDEAAESCCSVVVPILLSMAEGSPPTGAASALEEGPPRTVQSAAVDNRQRFQRWTERLRADVVRTSRKWRRQQKALTRVGVC